MTRRGATMIQLRQNRMARASDTARRIAQPPKATFVTRLRPFGLPGRAARQLPDQSTIIGWIPPPQVFRAFGAHCQRACGKRILEQDHKRDRGLLADFF
jgi:hypothetical protein